MIQDIYPHRIDISYREEQVPGPEDLIVRFEGTGFLCKKDREGKYELPCFEELAEKDDPGAFESIYLFELDNRKMFLLLGEKRLDLDGFEYEDIGVFRSSEPKELMFAVTTAYHLCLWHKDNIYCGRCGTRTVHDRKERMMRCPNCGNTIYPRIMPSVIVGVTWKDSILLTRYNRPGAKLSALVAGFCEIGETGEDTVKREVFEETGLRVKNIRYYKSQPWGISAGGLLLGYWCEAEDGSIVHADGDELAEAVWVKREDLKERILPTYPTLTAEMIGVFASGEN